MNSLLLSLRDAWARLWMPKSKRPQPRKACTLNRDCILWDGHTGECFW